MSGFFDILVKGGPVMVPLVLCSVVALAISIERFVNLKRASTNPDKLMLKVKKTLAGGDTSNAVGFCEATPGPVARVMGTAIGLLNLPPDQIKEGVNQAYLEEVPRLERGLTTLSTIITVAPLLGLLGTITGLMKLFKVIAGGEIGNSEALSSGIAEALITTAAGLCIAITFLVLYNLLAAQVERLTIQMEKAVTELINFVRKEGR